MSVRVLLAAVAGLVVAACGTGPQLTFATLPNSNDPTDPNNCFGNHIYLMTVVDAGGQAVASGRECVEFPEDFSAKVFKDTRGHMYVFVVNNSASGTGEPPQDIYIRRVDADRRALYEVARLQMTDGDITGHGLGWDVKYDVRETETGSLQAVITYAPSPEAGAYPPPEKQIVVHLGPVGPGGGPVGPGGPGPARPAPEASVRPAPPAKWCNGLGPGYRMVALAIIDRGQTLAHEETCQSPGVAYSAQAAVDRRGRIYMLVRTHAAASGSTNGKASDWLSIYGLRNAGSPAVSYADSRAFTWIGDMILSPAEDPAAQWPATYLVRDTDGGGLEVIVDYAPVKSMGCCTPPEQQMSIQIGP